MENSAGLHCGAGAVVGSDQRQSGGSGKQLGVGIRSEQLSCILRIKDFSVIECNHLDAPKTASQVRGREDRIKTSGDRIVRGGVELRR
jgi:hypothetical protein